MSASPAYAQSLAFLLSQVGAQAASVFAEQLAPLGVSPRAFGVLSNLALAEGQSQQQLAHALGIHRNNMVRLIDEMEAAGWLRRQRSTADRRAFELHLTTQGRSIVSQVNELIPSIEQRLADGLNRGQRAALTAMLQEIAENLGLDPGIHPHLRARKGRALDRDQ